jgi:sporulation protein YlmC with PRC-barrel domain
MSDLRTLNIASELRGRAVVVPDTAEKLGEVSDLIVHPTDGRVLGLILRAAEGEERALRVDDFVIGPEAVMAAEGALLDLGDLRDSLSGGARACGELVGVSVVTEDGKLLGRVSEIHASVKRPWIFYRVAGSALQRFLGGGFFIAGNVPHFYSREGLRLIVPADTADHCAASSLAEVLQSPKRETVKLSEAQP